MAGGGRGRITARNRRGGEGYTFRTLRYTAGRVCNGAKSRRHGPRACYPRGRCGGSVSGREYTGRRARGPPRATGSSTASPAHPAPVLFFPAPAARPRRRPQPPLPMNPHRAHPRLLTLAAALALAPLAGCYTQLGAPSSQSHAATPAPQPAAAPAEVQPRIGVANDPYLDPYAEDASAEGEAAYAEQEEPGVGWGVAAPESARRYSDPDAVSVSRYYYGDERTYYYDEGDYGGGYSDYDPYDDGYYYGGYSADYYHYAPTYYSPVYVYYRPYYYHRPYYRYAWYRPHYYRPYYTPFYDVAYFYDPFYYGSWYY